MLTKTKDLLGKTYHLHDTFKNKRAAILRANKLRKDSNGLQRARVVKDKDDYGVYTCHTFND